MKIKIKKGKENIFYVSFIVLLVVSFVVFLTSKNFMHDDTPLSQTPFDEKITGLNQTDVVLKKWEYNPDTNIMQVILQMTSVGSDTIKPSISFSARLKNSTDNLPVEVVYKENNMYVVLLKNISAEYKVVGLYVNEKRNEKMLKSELGSQLMSEKEMDTYLKKYEGEKILIKGDYRKIETNKHIKKKEELIYLQDILKMQVKNSQDKIDSLREKISIQEDVKKTLNTEIQSLKNEKKYQTKEEIRETERNVLNRESEIEDANKIQKEIADHIKLEQDKIKKRNEQLKDIEEKSQGISKK